MDMDPEDVLAAQQAFGPPEDDTTEPPATEEPSEESAEPPVDTAALIERLKKLEQRVGTDDDVSVLKSQRDKAKNEVESLRPALETLQQQINAVALQRAADDEQTFDQQWGQWIAAQPDRQAAIARYEIAKTQRNQDRREADLIRRQQAMQYAQEQAQVSVLIDNTKRIFKDLAQQAGVPPTELDDSSEDALRASFTAGLAKKQRLDQAAPRTPGHKPQRGGAPAQAKDVRSWFSQKTAAGDWKGLNAAFDAAENIRGLDINEIIRR